MNKSSKKPPFDKARALAVRKVSDMTGCSQAYVRTIISGSFTGGRSEEIMSLYRRIKKQLDEIVA